MATPLSSVIEIINTLKSNEVIFANADIPIQHAKLGVIQASVNLVRDWNVTVTSDVDGKKTGMIDADLSGKEIYLCGLYSLRNFAYQEHHGLTQKAVNFKTINFAVTGLTERAKEAMRIVWWLDNEIGRTLTAMTPMTMGSSSEMGEL